MLRSHSSAGGGWGAGGGAHRLSYLRERREFGVVVSDGGRATSTGDNAPAGVPVAAAAAADIGSGNAADAAAAHGSGAPRQATDV
jgi:hypothetical protein